MSRFFVGSTISILVAACSQTSPTKDPSASSAEPSSTGQARKDELACTADSDCVESSRSSDDCCTECESRAMNQAGLERLNEECRGKPGGPPECPSLDCPNEGTVPRCVEQRCTMVET